MFVYCMMLRIPRGTMLYSQCSHLGVAIREVMPDVRIRIPTR